RHDVIQYIFLYTERGQADLRRLDITEIRGGIVLSAGYAIFVGCQYRPIYIILPNRAELYERNLTAI
ncbi:MAG: hypothetical protein J5510_02775, partial [Prevotella sp.]|nr:hypothetical protein [Prevotella sp.]